MAVELLRRGVVDRLRSLAFWCAGVAGYIVLVAAIFPSLKGSADLDKLLKDYPDALKQLLGISGSGSLSSGAGFLDAELFGLMLPILVLVMAVAGGAGLFAGEEDAGRLELILSYPVSRTRAVLAKAGLSPWTLSHSPSPPESRSPSSTRSSGSTSPSAASRARSSSSR